MSNQVGFSFQGDVTSGASLIYAGTGRLLKALSDGGVDFYAVGAAIQLGKCFEISQSRELQITRLVQSRRTGRAGFLAKALSIGWGHSDVAAELVRIRSGAAALLLMSALTTGATHFVAAQAFSELLSLAGCDADMLPTVDAIRPMIAYLAPLVTDGTFDAILSNVTCTIQKVFARSGRSVPPELLQIGDAGEWSRAIHQLMLSASRGEEAFLSVKQRAAWISTFASYVLDMRVRVLDGDKILWEAAGTRGAATIYLGWPPFPSHNPIENVFLVSAPISTQGIQSMEITYSISEVLDTAFALEPTLNESLHSLIRVSIVRVLLSMSTTARFSTYLGTRDSIYPMGQLRNPRELSRRISNVFNIPEHEQSIGLDTSKPLLRRPSGDDSASPLATFPHFDSATRAALLAVCDFHSATGDFFDPEVTCICSRMHELVHGVSSTGLALMLCSFDKHDLRVSAALITGRKQKQWYVLTMKQHLHISCSHALLHLSELIHVHGELIGLTSADPLLLALSAGTMTVYCKIILDKEAFDPGGQFISIAPGRISMDGLLRTLVYESHSISASDYHRMEFIRQLRQSAGTQIAPWNTVRPLYIPGPAQLKIEVSLSERNIALRARIVHSDPQSSQSSIDIRLLDAIHSFMSCDIGEACSHTQDRNLVVKRDTHVVLSTFASSLEHLSHLIMPIHEKTCIILYATSERQVEQIIQVMLSIQSSRHQRSDKTFADFQILHQGASCLDCVIYSSPKINRPGTITSVIMS